MRPTSKRSDSRLDIDKVIKDFQTEEAISSHRKGTFKIDRPFEEALNTILRSKPETQGKKEKGR